MIEKKIKTWYLNVNTIRNKVVQLTDICKTSQIKILCIDETKLDSSFPTHRFIFLITSPQLFRGTEIHQEEEIIYMRNGIIAKRLTVYETQNTASICVEITIKNRILEVWNFICLQTSQ